MQRACAPHTPCPLHLLGHWAMAVATRATAIIKNKPFAIVVIEVFYFSYCRSRLKSRKCVEEVSFVCMQSCSMISISSFTLIVHYRSRQPHMQYTSFHQIHYHPSHFIQGRINTGVNQQVQVMIHPL